MLVQPRRVRDLTLVELPSTTMVIACDSSGAIGCKPFDHLNVPGEVLGRIIASVPLMEVLASGATPIAVVNTLCVETFPTGISIIAGIEQAVKEAGLSLSVINGSTEENMPTKQTGLGVTVIGTANSDELKLGSSKANDLIYCIGKPLVGHEVIKFQKQAAQINTMRMVLNMPGIHEILPVGSKGVKFELEQLANLGGFNFQMLLNAQSLDLEKSAGPATCFLVSLAEGSQSCMDNLNIPITLVARLIR